MKIHAQRLLGTLILALAAGGVLAGSTLAEPSQPRFGVPVPEVSERPGQGGLGVVSLVPVPEVSERPGQGGLGLVSLVPVPEVSERPGQGGLGVVAIAPVPEVSERPGQGDVTASTGLPSVTTASDGGFLWGDAMLVASSALGGVLLLGAATALIIRHRRRVSLI